MNLFTAEIFLAMTENDIAIGLGYKNTFEDFKKEFSKSKGII